MEERLAAEARDSGVTGKFAALRARRAKVVAPRRHLLRLRNDLLEQQRLLRREEEAAHVAARLGGQVEALIGAAPVGSCVIDGDGTFARVNDAYASMLGYRPDELVGR